MRLSASFAQLPLPFEPNLGQTAAEVDYLCRGPGYTLFLSPAEAVLALRAGEVDTTVRLKPVAAAPRPKKMLRDKLPGVSNYFIGSDPAQWRRGVPQYARAGYESIYPKIDLIYYGNEDGRLEHDFVVHPGGDVGRIAFDISGAESLRLTEPGDLELRTAEGVVTLRRPVAYQEQAGRRQPVAAAYELQGRRVTLRVGEFDRSRTLVIDPVLVFSSYLGAGAAPEGLVLDSADNAYISGETSSVAFPTSGYQNSYGGGSSDAFVMKINAAGTAVVYSTYLGGSAGDRAYELAVDASGCAYVCGTTTSADFPTQSAYQSSLAGSSDGFIAKLGPTGGTMSYSTYLGGSGVDILIGIAVDASGRAFVNGSTFSSDIPVPNALQNTHAGGSSDGYLAKLSADGQSLVFGTYRGGSGYDSGSYLALDSAGKLIALGVSNSVDFPTSNALQAARAGDFDVTVTKLEPDGSAVNFSSYLGGSSFDGLGGLAIDSANSIYIAGITRSSDFPTAGAYQASHQGSSADHDAFVTKLSSNGSSLIYSTYLGGTADDQAKAIAVDSLGQAWVTGSTGANDFPTLNPLMSTDPAVPYHPGVEVVFITELNAGGNGLVSSTYLSPGIGRGIQIDSAGRGVITGLASDHLPLSHPFHTTGDGFLAKLDTSAPASYTVTTTADSGAGSLREAITYCNNHPGLDTITFDIAGAGVQVIQPTSVLPTIAEAVVIDGYSQPGAAANSLAEGTDATIRIELDGSSLGANYGLTLGAAGSLVKGLAVHHCAGGGIRVSAGGNTVAGCFIGSTAAGTAGANGGIAGIVIDSGAAANTIGGSTPAARNLISGNTGSGVYLTGAGAGNVIAGNLIGLNATGTAALANGQHGISLQSVASSTTIGGTLAGGELAGRAPGNVISGNGTGSHDGIHAVASAIQVRGNLIGLDAAGTVAVPNHRAGIHSNASATVGLAGVENRNVISGNGGDGIVVSGAAGGVFSNYIGTNRAGDAAVPNGGRGVYLSKSNPAIGGTLAANDRPGMPPGNVISGNATDGVRIDYLGGTDSTNGYLRGNLIGLTADGQAALPNGRDGVSFGQGSFYESIGGTDPRLRNVISGNGRAGIYGDGHGNPAILPTTCNIDGIHGNYIGTNVTGDAAVPNTVGVWFDGHDYVAGNIGGKLPGQGNVISGNTGPGIRFSDDNLAAYAFGNLIGVAADGTTPLGNGVGVLMEGTASYERVGWTDAGSGNLIAHNIGAAIRLTAGTSRNRFLGNSIHHNGAGIVLEGSANDGIAAPVVKLVTVGAGETTVRWSWSGAQAGPYRVEFYGNSSGDQGMTFLGAATPATIAGEQTTVLSTAIGASDTVTATVTDVNYNGSEFSAPVGAATHLAITGQPSDGSVGALLPPVTVTVRDAADQTATGTAWPVTIALLNNPSAATLSGTSTRTTVDGVATFTDLQLDQPGVGYTLQVSGSPLAAVDTAAFDVAAGATSPAQSTAAVPAGTAGTSTTIAVQARDASGNPRPSGGDAVVVEVTGANPATPTVTDHGDGTYTASYTPTVTGNDSVVITIGGTGIAGSPFTSAVGAGPTSPAHSTATVPNGTAGAATSLTVQARDAQGNARLTGGDTVVITITGANSATPTVTDHGNGTYTASYTPVVAGDDTVAISIGGTAISGSPFTSRVGVGSTDPAQSTATVPDGRAGSSTTIAVQARDAKGNPRGVGGDVVAITISGANTASPTVTDEGDGRYTASYTPTVAGADVVAITIGGTGLAGSPFASSVAPGAVEAAHSTATVPSGTAGSVTNLVIQARDAFGNARTTGGDTVVVQVSGANTASPAVTDNGDGTYRASYTPTVAGIDSVAITLAGAPLAGSPYGSQVGVGATTAGPSTATVPNGVAGSATTITVRTKDAQGNLRTTGGDTVTILISGANPASPPVTDHGDGTYSASYLPMVTGVDQVAIAIGGAAVGGSPYHSQVDAGASSAGASVAVVPNGTAGSSTVITVRARDAQGNPRTRGGDGVTITITGANPAALEATDQGDGTYTASYLPQVAGRDTVAVTLGGQPVGGSPYLSQVDPGAADPEHTTAAVPEATAGRQVDVRIIVRDALDNPRLLGGDTVTVGLAGANSETPAVTAQGDGTFLASYTPTVAGIDRLSVILNGVAIAGSPFEIPVAAGAPDGGRSRFSLTPDVAAADGAEAITVTVVLKDAFDNPIAGVAADRVTVSASPAGARITGSSAATDAAGSTTATVTAASAGAYTLTVVVDELTLEQQATARFRSVFETVLRPGLRFFALPFVPDDPRPEALLGATAAGQVSVWRPASGSLTGYQAGDPDPLAAIMAGRGFWSRFDQPQVVRVLGDRTPSGPFQFDLQLGYNALGNPFDAPLRWDPATIEVYQHGALLGNLSQSELWQKVRPYVWVWDSEAHGHWLVMAGFSVSDVPRLAGFWLEALAPDLSVVVPRGPASRRQSRDASAQAWQLHLNARTDAASSVLTVGVDPSLSRALSISSPPELGVEEMLKLEVGTAEGRLAGEIRTAGREQTWDLWLTSAVDGEATLSWPSLLRELPPGLLVELFDATTGRRWLLNTTSSIHLPVSRNPRPLRLTARTGQLQRTAITGLRLHGGRGAGFTVALDVTGPARVILTIKGLGGRLVRQVHGEATAAGPLQLAWDGLDQNGRRVPLGSYLLEAIAQSDNGATTRVTRTVTVH